MSKKRQIHPMDKTINIKNVPKPFGIHKFKHDGSVRSVTFSNDGSLLATGDCAGKTIIYDVKSKTKINEFKHDDGVWSVSFSPDGGLLATGDGANKTTIYDVKSKTKVDEFIHDGLVYCVSFSPDGSLLATGDFANKTTIYDVKSKTKIHEFIHDGEVLSLSFSNDGSLLATGDCANKTIIYDVISKTKKHEFKHDIIKVKGTAFHVKSVSFSNDGVLLATGGGIRTDKRYLKGKTTIYNVMTNAKIYEVKHNDVVNSVSFSHDGTLLATGEGEDRKLREDPRECKLGKTIIYDVKSKTKIHEFKHDGSVFSVSLSKDGTLLATGDDYQKKDEGKTIIYDLKTKAKIHEFEHSHFVHDVSFSNVGSLLATGDGDSKTGKTTIFDVVTKTKIHEFKHDGLVHSIEFSNNGSLLATGDCAGKTVIYDVKSKIKIYEVKHDGPVNSVSFSPDGRLLATGDNANKTIIYDVKSKTRIHDFIHDGRVMSVSFSPDGRLLATGDIANKTTIYDVKSKTKIHEFEHVSGAGGVWDVSFSPDGSLLATGDSAAKLTIYDIKTKTKIFEINNGKTVLSVAFSNNGLLLATSDTGNNWSMYDFKSKAKIHEFTHHGFVRNVAFSNDDFLFATADSDRNTATIYTPQLAHPGDVLLSGIKPLTVQNSSLLYRPCPTTHTTFLHRCVEEGDSNLLQEIQSNIVMKQDKNKRTPLDIAIQQKSHQKCLLLVKACFSTPNNYSHDTLVQSIPKLIEEKYHDVVECIFENIMIKTETSELERFSLPQPLFRKYIGIGSEKLFKGKTNSTVVEVQTYRIILQSLFEKKRLINILENASLKTFETKAMQYIVTYLWKQLLRYYFIQSMLYLIVVFCFTYGHFCGLFEATTIWYQMYWYVLLASGILILVFVILEFRHVIRSGFSEHFKSSWNRYEVLTYATSIASITTKLASPIPGQEILDASGLILLWIGIFNKIRGFEKFSVLITTFTQILYDIRYFTIMLAVIICAFAMAFKLLVHGQGIFNNFVAIESTYNLMFGLTNLDIFVDYDDNKISIAARFFVSFFLFLVVIVMFNMLIAIMADSFDNVQANLKIQSFRSKAKVCADLLIDFRPTHHIFKEQYLHICTVRDEAGENAIMNSQSQWEGRLKAVKKEIQDVKAEMKADMGEISAKIDKLMEALIKN